MTNAYPIVKDVCKRAFFVLRGGTMTAESAANAGTCSVLTGSEPALQPYVRRFPYAKR
jgi:hypothetical protein